MRNKGFYWFLTILLLVVSIYQITFSFVGINIEKKAEMQAEERVDALMASTPEGDSTELPNGTWVNFTTDHEAYDLAKSAFINDILKDKNKEKVYLGNTFSEVKNKSIALGLDLEGGMSVTLEISMPDLVKSKAMNPKDLHFAKPFDLAVEKYNTQGGSFVDVFVEIHKELYPDRKLIREFSTDEVVSEIGNKATDAAVKSYLKKLSDGALDGVETIMENRINQFGVAQPNITKDVSTNRIYIELPGVKDQATVKQRLQSTANLEFYLAYKSQELGGLLNELLVDSSDDEIADEDFEDLFKEEGSDSTTVEEAASEPVDELDTLVAESKEADSVEVEEEKEVKLSSFAKMFQVNLDQGRFYNTPAIGFAQSRDTSKINTILNDKTEELMMENIRFVWGAKEEKLGATDTLYYTLYALKIPDDQKARVGGTDIKDARVSFDPNIGERGVSVEMNARGADEWGRMTTENVGNFIAITMDDKVYSAPVINGPITGGSTLISGSFTVAEAQGLTDLLNAGALPAPSNIVDEAVVGPTIGAANARSGLMSFGIALGLVLIYLVFYYGKAGLVANTALLVNIVLLLGFLAAFGAVLTLAGIAGIVLTMGMAVDANVLINERAREEIREGKGMKMVIKDGYKNALSAIIDANITTLLVAVVLKMYGSGPIESFATTLIIGIFTSLFSAVVVTRLIFEYNLAKKREFTFSTKFTKDVFIGLDVKFIKNRKKFFLLSIVMVIIALVGIFSRGLKPSVEFTGGRTYETVFTKPVGDKIEDIKDLLRDALKEGNASAAIELKSRNSDYRLEIATDYLQGTPNSESTVREELLEALASGESDFGVATIESSRSISASVSEELQRDSLISIGLAMALIFSYILIRFGTWQYGLGAVISLGHDVIIVLGIFALGHGFLPFNMEIDQAFIAAILTIVGYSINDTVVVFDRIREFFGKYHKKSNEDIIDSAINSTIGRTINTASTTFIVLLTIFIFDGGAIKGFIFALMVGVIVGTYSSICVASPIMYELTKGKERGRELKEPETTA